ncbi:MAG: hypothetical protein GX575_18345 [Candidatus Anammoximicrobium sp.]|nr:hypothetical protein [Candidatus Anammoximicrobium sp.]
MTEQYTDNDLLAMAVALLTEQGFDQRHIQKHLALPNQEAVSRRLSQAKDRGWFVKRSNLPEEVREEVEGIAFPRLENLKTLLEQIRGPNHGVGITSVHVICSGQGNSANEMRSLQTFGNRCAECVAGLLQGAETCGVAWGRTIMCMVEGLERYRPNRREISFFPLAGEPFNHRDTGVSASTAAKRLAECFKSSKPAKSLHGVPLRIPRAMNGQSDTIRSFLAQCRDYNEIFGTATPLISKVATIITGVGDVASSEDDPWFRETRESEDMKSKELNALAAGNLGGVWLSRDRADARQEKAVRALNARWLGVQEEHLKACAERAAGSSRGKPAGVIVIAAGAQKAGIVKRSLGYVNHLIIDHILADHLLDDRCCGGSSAPSAAER